MSVISEISQTLVDSVTGAFPMTDDEINKAHELILSEGAREYPVLKQALKGRKTLTQVFETIQKKYQLNNYHYFPLSLPKKDIIIN